MKITRKQLKRIIKEEILREQQEPREGLSDDGNSFTAKFKLGSDVQMAMEQADLAARDGLQAAGKEPGRITSRAQFNGYIYSTATILGK